MSVPNLDGLFKLVGGISGAAVLLYFIIMLHYARKKDERLRFMELQLARIEGLLLGRMRK